MHDAGVGAEHQVRGLHQRERLPQRRFEGHAAAARGDLSGRRAIVRQREHREGGVRVRAPQVRGERREPVDGPPPPRRPEGRDRDVDQDPRAVRCAARVRPALRRRLALGGAQVQARRQVGVRRDPERRAERPDQLHLVRSAAVRRRRRRGDRVRVEQVVLPPADTHAPPHPERRELQHGPRFHRPVRHHRVHDGVVALGAQRGHPAEMPEPGARIGEVDAAHVRVALEHRGVVRQREHVERDTRVPLADRAQQPRREDQVADPLRAQHQDRVSPGAPVRRRQRAGVAHGRGDRAHDGAARGALDAGQPGDGHPR